MIPDIYFFKVVDDDFLITAQTNVSLLLDLLESTDVSIAGGYQENAILWEGAIRVVERRHDATLVHYPYVFYEHLQRWNCFASTTSKQIFLAKVDDVINAGSWNPERKFFEHLDFMLRLRKARLKLVFCPDVVFRNNPKNFKNQTSSSSLRFMRFGETHQWNEHFIRTVGIKHNVFCNEIRDYNTTDYCFKPIVMF